MHSMQKKFDLHKMQQLALEGTGLPFTSRIKDKLRAVLSSHPGGWLSAAPAAETGATGSKKGAKSSQSSGSSTDGGSSIELLSGRLQASGVEECVSSDDEDIADKQHQEGLNMSHPARVSPGENEFDLLANQETFVNNLKYLHDYVDFNVQNAATISESCWPITLAVPRRRPNVNPLITMPLPGQASAQVQAQAFVGSGSGSASGSASGPAPQAAIATVPPVSAAAVPTAGSAAENGPRSSYTSSVSNAVALDAPSMDGKPPC
jgi:hypothetical protein